MSVRYPCNAWCFPAAAGGEMAGQASPGPSTLSMVCPESQLRFGVEGQNNPLVTRAVFPRQLAAKRRAKIASRLAQGSFDGMQAGPTNSWPESDTKIPW